MRAVWCVKNLLNGADCMLYVRELSHSHLRRDDRSKSQGSWKIQEKLEDAMEFRNSTLPSVTIPRVPSAPMNSFVVSKPAEDFLALLRVLMTLPLGRTTVYEMS